MTLRIGPPSLPPRAELFIAARKGNVEIYGTRAALAALGRDLIALAEAEDGADEAVLISRPDEPAIGLLPGSRGYTVYRRPPGRVRP